MKKLLNLAHSFVARFVFSTRSISIQLGQKQNFAPRTTLKFKSFFVLFIIFSTAVSLPIFVHADVSKTSGNTGITYECGDGPTAGDCSFQDLVAATKNVTNFGAKFAISFSVVILALVGGRYMFYADNAGERKKTHAMLTSVVIGIVVILAAWLIVTLITTSLLKPDVVQFGM
ncbi:MAG TPA: hypothetical protein VJC13_02475 [Candidatus Paceibacterota bacterium]